MEGFLTFITCSLVIGGDGTVPRFSLIRVLHTALCLILHSISLYTPTHYWRSSPPILIASRKRDPDNNKQNKILKINIKFCQMHIIKLFLCVITIFRRLKTFRGSLICFLFSSLLYVVISFKSFTPLNPTVPVSLTTENDYMSLVQSTWVYYGNRTDILDPLVPDVT